MTLLSFMNNVLRVNILPYTFKNILQHLV